MIDVTEVEVVPETENQIISGIEAKEKAAAEEKPKSRTMSLKEAGQYDWKIGARAKKTGWGIVSSERAKSGKSRQARIRAKTNG